MAELGTIRRAFDVMDVLWRLDGAGPSKVASHLDMPRSTAHDYLRTLQNTGFVVEEGGKYRLGFRFLAMGSRLQYRTKLFQVARGELKALASETEMNVNIGIEEGNKWVLLGNSRGDRGLELGTYPGMRTPLHTHAAAKSILAHLPAAQCEKIISNGLESVTSYSITDPGQLREELQTIRERDFIIDRDQQVIGMGVVAAPVIVEETVRGSVAIVCPSGRLEDETFRVQMSQKIRESADTIRINYLYGDY